MTTCRVHCPICQQPFDWLRGYGSECRCCCKECYEEFDWRRAIAITGRIYTKSWKQHLLEKEPIDSNG